MGPVTNRPFIALSGVLAFQIDGQTTASSSALHGRATCATCLLAILGPRARATFQSGAAAH